MSTLMADNWCDSASFASSSGPPCHILIVDDMMLSRLLLSDILAGAGYGIREAANGIEALAMAEKTSPELILLDIVMPEMDGFATCRLLKANPVTADTPVIFITSLEDQEDILRGFEAGAADYIRKPFSPEEIKARVRTHLNLKQATDKLKHHAAVLKKIILEESRQLIKAERQAALGQLIQGIVHNMRGPLSAISGSVQVSQMCVSQLGDAYKAENCSQELPRQLEDILPRLRKANELIVSSARRLSDMITRMMERSRSNQAMAQEIIDLNQIVSEELTFLEADLDFKHSVAKEIQLAATKLMIRAVPSEISQVLNNLISNAMDALRGQEKAQLRITTQPYGDHALITVSDNGPGIAPEHLERIFEPFFTTKNKGTHIDGEYQGPIGTGLGLYMSMMTVTDLDGELSVRSAPGKTTFEVRIPLVAG